jgi:peptide deformylase
MIKMPIRKIVMNGDPCLGKRCRTVTDFNPRLHTLLDDMKDTLIEAGGAGLAACQVGVLRRAAIVILEDDSVVEIINPEIIDQEGEQDGLEGCLSVPGYRGQVSRPMKVKVRAQDRHGNSFETEAEGFTARAFCHEIDHLEGMLYTSLATEMYDNDHRPETEDTE